MAKERRGAMLSTGQLVGSLVGPLIGGVLADLTGSYRIPFYCTSATIRLSMGFVWVAEQERFVAPPKVRGRGSILGSLIAVATRRRFWRCSSCC
jgi:MFS transporter, DHA1 family, multidrug resistance protein